MKTSDWYGWFQGWLKRHPVAPMPPQIERSYRQEVMDKVRALGSPRPALQWLPKPRLSLAWGAAVAAVLMLIVLTPQGADRLVDQVEEEWQILLEVGEMAQLEPETLEDALQAEDRMMLAEAISQGPDADQIEATLDLIEALEELGEFSPEETLTDEEWLELLGELDEEDLALS